VSAARRPLALSVRAEGFAVGQAVKVKEDVLVYHIPKTKGAEVNLKGMSGVVDTVRLPLHARRPNQGENASVGTVGAGAGRIRSANHPTTTPSMRGEPHFAGGGACLSFRDAYAE
jgi:hypothetical protein